MNLLDCTVTEILGTPYQEYGKWWIRVRYDCYGRESETNLMMDTEDGINNIKLGFTFLA